MINPVMVEVTRGGIVESRHRGALAVVRSDGTILLSIGDTDVPTYARSAIKPIQAVPLVESGAYSAYQLDLKRVALACASHSGEPDHVSEVGRWLKDIGLNETDLACGIHDPLSQDASRRLYAAGEIPGRLHSNCSGKHAGFLTTAQHLGEPTRGYTDRDHPVQIRVRKVLEEFSGMTLTTSAGGIDGCGIPVIAIPLIETAFAMSRIADERGWPQRRQHAVRLIRQAMTENPFYVAGSERFCTQVMKELAGRVLVKTGAEGFFTAAIPELNLGVALKIDDGAGRASQLIIAVLIERLLKPEQFLKAPLASLLNPQVVNIGGHKVGEIRPVSELFIQ